MSPSTHTPGHGIWHNTWFHILHPLISESLVPIMGMTIPQENFRKTICICFGLHRINVQGKILPMVFYDTNL